MGTHDIAHNLATKHTEVAGLECLLIPLGFHIQFPLRGITWIIADTLELMASGYSY
jgi:hypothetical protein